MVGPKGKHDPDRTAVRHGHEDGSMTLGGRRVGVRRPRVRSADAGRELAVKSYEYFADRDPLTRAVMDRMLAGVSTRGFARVGEPVGTDVEQSSSSTGKTAVSDMFIERTRTALGELMSRRLDDVRLAVMMLDGLEIADRTHVVALGITTEGVKVPLGLWEGSTENATTCTRPAISRPSSIITASRTSSSRRPISSPSAVRVRSMNASETVLFDVEVDDCSTSSPTGSPTRANLRVETPASIRSITARVSGSRSAKYS